MVAHCTLRHPRGSSTLIRQSATFFILAAAGAHLVANIEMIAAELELPPGFFRLARSLCAHITIRCLVKLCPLPSSAACPSCGYPSNSQSSDDLPAGYRHGFSLVPPNVSPDVDAPRLPSSTAGPLAVYDLSPHTAPAGDSPIPPSVLPRHAMQYGSVSPRLVTNQSSLALPSTPAPCAL